MIKLRENANTYQYDTKTPKITAFVVPVGTARSLWQSLIQDFWSGILQCEAGCSHQTFLIFGFQTGKAKINHFQFSLIRFISKE